MDSLSPQLNYYRPSGVFPPAGIVTLIVGVAAGSVLGALYAFINHHIPLIYLNLLLLGVFASLLGWIGSWGVHKFHVRNAYAAALMGAVIFLAAYTVHWFFYIATVIADFETDSPYDVAAIFDIALDLMRNPEDVWEFIRDLNEYGIWSISRPGSSNEIDVNGIWLTVAWLCEALTLMYTAIKKPWEEARRPYSERQGKWMEPKYLPILIAFIENLDEFKRAVVRGDYSSLTTPLTISDDAPLLKYAKVCLYPDTQSPCVSVINVSVSLKKNKENVTEIYVVKCLKIPPATATDISNALAGDSIR
ncbi:MAG: hypothetical protein LBO21_04820 [Synergistaceae bacterium]|jgi:hypothetical protein|nr:hypothetical protein [Synergistaceae bacterium]